jgi:hypothetical protein
MGGFNPIHDFLHATLTRAAGDKKAFTKYKEKMKTEGEMKKRIEDRRKKEKEAKANKSGKKSKKKKPQRLCGKGEEIKS